MRKKATISAFTVLCLVLALVSGCRREAETATASSVQTKCYSTSGGDKWVCASGGEFEMQSGSTLDIQSGATAGIDSLTVANGLTVTAGGATVTAGGLTVAAGSVSVPVNTEHIGTASVITAAVTYQSTGALFTIADGETWLVHKLFMQTTTNFDCTGDNCTLTIGDGNDTDGFLAAADASLQTTFTEATGYAAGWYGIEAGSGGAYTLDDGGPFVYAPSGAAETIDVAIGGTDPAAGAGTVYIIYTRIQ